jgi:lipopolysaccharide cholinephosphotransferase
MGVVGGKFFSENDLRADGLRELSQEEKKQLQMVLLRMLKDVIRLCRKHNFCYMLVYGSALGAIRHSGFIPWDDDLDIGMLRKDYVPFLKTFRKEYENKYEVIYPRDTSYNLFTCAFGKIYLKNSYNSNYYDLSSPLNEGVHLDIFPIENMPNNILIYCIYGGLSKILFFYIIRSVRIYEFSKLSYSELAFKKYPVYARRIFHFYRLKCIVGFAFSFFTYNKWIYLYDKWVSSFPKGDFLGIPSIRKYNRGRLRQEIFIPVKIGFFEGEKVCLPRNTHEHLITTYGNYMQLPEECERECHTVIEIK